MFIMDDAPRFEAEVAGKMPGGSDFTFKAVFAALGSDATAEFDLGTDAGTKDFLRKVTVDFSDIVTEDDTPVPYSDSARDWLIDKPWTRAALVKSYFGQVYGALLGN